MEPKYHQAKPPPWEDGGTSITQFESGLIRAQRSYLVPTNRAGEFATFFSIGGKIEINAATDDDGVFIYPSPEIEDLGNGFTRIRVTAYGRTPGASTGAIERTYEPVVVIKANLVDGDVIFGPGVRCLFPVYRITRTSRKDDVPFLPNIEDLKFRDPIYRESDQAVIDPTIEFGNLKTELITSIQRAPTTGYGEMQEEVFFVRFQPATASE
jgi:hypothetical protein